MSLTNGRGKRSSQTDSVHLQAFKGDVKSHTSSAVKQKLSILLLVFAPDENQHTELAFCCFFPVETRRKTGKAKLFRYSLNERCSMLRSTALTGRAELSWKSLKYR